jgi:hypothetical protein
MTDNVSIIDLYNLFQVHLSCDLASLSWYSLYGIKALYTAVKNLNSLSGSVKTTNTLDHLKKTSKNRFNQHQRGWILTLIIGHKTNEPGIGYTNRWLKFMFHNSYLMLHLAVCIQTCSQRTKSMFPSHLSFQNVFRKISTPCWKVCCHMCTDDKEWYW